MAAALFIGGPSGTTGKQKIHLNESAKSLAAFTIQLFNYLE